jgi:hypothetical protein
MKNENIDLERDLFALAFSVIRHNWVPCLIAALLLLASNVGEGYFPAALPFAVLRALIIMILGYSIYRTLLSEGRMRGFRAMATDCGRVPWRYAGVMLMILTPILILGIVWNAPGSSIGPNNLNDLIFGVVMVIAYATGYVLLGTALPEIAERGEVALSESIERGWANYRRIGRALVFGPWVFRAGSVLVMVGLSLAGVTTDLFGGETGAFQPAALGPMLFFTGAHVVAEVLTAIVLTRAYLRYPVVTARTATA